MTRAGPTGLRIHAAAPAIAAAAMHSAIHGSTPRRAGTGAASGGAGAAGAGSARTCSISIRSEHEGAMFGEDMRRMLDILAFPANNQSRP